MLPFGHVSAAYLISQIPYQNNLKLKFREILFILFCGIIFDFDFLLPGLVGMPGGTHHYLATHTPFSGVLFWLILYILLKKFFSIKIFLLGGLAMLSHLVLDDMSYWLSLVGLGTQFKPQIFWLFPFDSRRVHEMDIFFEYYTSHPYTNREFLENYLFRWPKLFYPEIILTIIALIVWVKGRLKLGGLNKIKRDSL